LQAATRRKKISGFSEKRVFKECDVWGAFRENQLVGMIAFRSELDRSMYVLPHIQGDGFGQGCCRLPKTRVTSALWTFQRNRGALVASTKQEASCSSGKRKGANKKKKSPMLSIFGLS